ncbi:hypothetical protein [Convivina intestini]|uniref:hypothetical protein n=1 Tax=Convivina intestini TaxID=1505726 RepID=UPI00200D9A24|nr:hypothetical protein [Convivina intestini]CAH1855717.1 hypothetical protein R077811_01101 [Convivina intestini]
MFNKLRLIKKYADDFQQFDEMTDEQFNRDKEHSEKIQSDIGSSLKKQQENFNLLNSRFQNTSR